VAGFIIHFMDNMRYIEEISKYCDPLSMLVIGNNGQLIRIYCPFSVIVVQPVGNLEKGDIVYVQAVKVTLELRDVFIINGRAYYLFYFRILL
jgi:hypothetical protein